MPVRHDKQHVEPVERGRDGAARETVVGTDVRSVEAYDAALAAALAAWMDEQITKAETVTLEQMDSRPKARRFIDGLAKLASPYL